MHWGGETEDICPPPTGLQVAKYQTPAGVDINKVGIAPQLVLDAAALAEVPTSGPAFCEYVQSAETAPPLLGAAQKR